MLRLVLAVCCAMLVTPGFGDEPATERATTSDTGSDVNPLSIPAKELATRLQRVLPENWAASVNADSEVVVARRDPVGWVTDAPNGPAFTTPGAAEAARAATLHPGPYRIVLHLGPKLTLEEFDQLTAENVIRARKRDTLYRGVRDIAHKFDEFLPDTPAEERRIAEYRLAVARIPRHDLPQFFTPEHGVIVYATWGPFDSIYHDETREECDRVSATLERFLGVYDPEEVRDGVRRRFRDSEE